MSHTAQLNGRDLAVDAAGNVLMGVDTPKGGVELPPASITFLTVGGAGNAACR